MRFDDRLVDTTYAADERCQIRLVSHSRDESQSCQEAWISERLLDRLRFLGLAYELPLLSRIPSDGETTYPEVQIASLEDELVFLFEIITDPALLHNVQPFAEFIRLAKHDPRGWSLTIERP